MGDSKFWLNTKELAELFQVERRTIQRWVKKAGLESDEEGRYHAPSLITWWREKQIEELTGDVKKVELALKKVKLEKEKFLLEREKGKWVEKEKVEVEWAQRVTEIKSGLLALEFRLSTQLANRKRSLAKVREIIKKEVLDLLWSYVREGEYTPKVNEGLPLDKQEELFWSFLEQLSEISCKEPVVKLECQKKRQKRKKK